MSVRHTAQSALFQERRVAAVSDRPLDGYAKPEALATCRIFRPFGREDAFAYSMQTNPDPEAALDCPEKRRLIEEAQAHLNRIAELSYSTAQSLFMGENKILELDRQAEEEIGKKERSLGALRQHRAEHGC